MMRVSIICISLWGAAIFLIQLNFSNGAVEIGRGLLGAYLLPFAPFLLAIVLALAATVISLTALVAPSGHR